MKHSSDLAQLIGRRAKRKVFIRDTGITAYEVYRCSAFHGLSERAILEKYPALSAEDLGIAVRLIRQEIQSRDHDELTGRPILPKQQLVHGCYYKGRCRNATIARWNAEENCFYHWREKFGAVYIETIMYPTDETEPWWDVFDVAEELAGCKFDIPFDREAQFQGCQDDLNEFTAEMWSGWSSRNSSECGNPEEITQSGQFSASRGSRK